MKNILIPTDFSSTSIKALNFAVNHFAKHQVVFHILNVYEPPQMKSGMLISINDILKKESQTGLTKVSKLIQTKFNVSENNIVIHSFLGDLITAIERLSEKTMFDAVVLGTQGSSGIKSLLFGSNASKVVQEIKNTPIFCIPDSYNNEPLKRAVFSVDLKVAPNPEARVKIKILLQQLNVMVTLLHIKTPFSTRNAEERLAQEKEFIKIFEGTNFEFSEMTADNYREGLFNYLKKHTDIGLLCMIPKKDTFIERKFLGSQTEEVSFSSKIPLLTVR